MSAPTAAASVKSPNQYQLSGEGISVAYFPDGFGPVLAGPDGPVCMTYQDSAHKLAFRRAEINEVDVPDMGTVLSVVLDRSVDLGDTTFSLLLPSIELPDQLGASTRVEALGVTTAHRTFLAGKAQRETYMVAQLYGEATVGVLPMAREG